jgi:NADPH:quinone reductase-like Zn-dependent oxidoreductase
MEESVRQIREWVEAGKLRPIVREAAPLAAAAELHRRLVSRQTMGKLVLLPWA